MFIKFILLIISLSISLHNVSYTKNYITYNRNKGQLGDRLITYAKIKWLSLKYNIPLLYKPFRFSSLLALDIQEIPYEEKLNRYFQKIVPIKQEKNIESNTNESTLYVSNYHFAIEGNFFRNHQPYFIPIKGKLLKQPNYFIREAYIENLCFYTLVNKNFSTILKKMFTPRITIEKLSLPKNITTVAIHICRENLSLSSEQFYNTYKVLTNKTKAHNLKEVTTLTPQEKIFFKKNKDKKWPLKFPPAQYYIDQVKLLSEILENRPLYLYIFTDDKNPKALCKKIKTAVNKSNITFACRSDNNKHLIHSTSFDDLFSLAQFDCIIRSASNFARISQIIGKHKIIIFPTHATWVNNKLIMDTINIIINNSDATYVESFTLDVSKNNDATINKIKKVISQNKIIKRAATFKT